MNNFADWTDDWSRFNGTLPLSDHEEHPPVGTNHMPWSLSHLDVSTQQGVPSIEPLDIPFGFLPAHAESDLPASGSGWLDGPHHLTPLDDLITIDALTEICFGMICDVQVRLNRASFKTGAADVLSSQQDSAHVILELQFGISRCDLVLPSGIALATLNTKTYRFFARMQQSFGVRFECSVHLQTWCHLLESSQREGKGDAPRLSIDVNVFGPRREADTIATEFSKAQIFLQEPHDIPEGIDYENPQCLDLAGFVACLDTSTPTTPTCPTSHMDMEDETKRDRTDEDTSAIGSSELDFDTLLDDLACHDGLVEATAATQISTELLDHQKEGLSFILERERLRETDASLPFRSLWERQETLTGAPLFQHVITGAKSAAAKECLGGLVADEMGLGKSLTMLSAIVGTINSGLAYARSITRTDSTGNGVIGAKSTLVVVPSALLMDTWAEETDTHLWPGALTYYKFHGNSRKIKYPSLLQHDLVLTTYGTIAADFSRDRSLLHSVHWYRIVLDEAHIIRNSSTKQYRAVTSLQAHYRWCLTGTPIQNTLDDLGSLMRFLRVPVLEDVAQFRRYITPKIGKDKSSTFPDYHNLRALLSSICLRRTKAILPLDQTEPLYYRLDFTTEERSEYSRIEHACKNALDLAVSGHMVKEAHQTVLEILLRLRLFCNNGGIYSHFIAGSDPNSWDPSETFSLLQQNDQATCYYCACDITSHVTLDALSGPDSALLTRCRKLVCSECYPLWEIEKEQNAQCPICNSCYGANITVAGAGRSIFPSMEFPTKLKALCNDIELHKHMGKSIVFSFWKRSLDILETLFTGRGIKFERVDGSVLFSKRKIVLQRFQDQSDVAVLLMTLGTGAVGLNNLTVANRVHILEPQWNPSVENQAIGRVLRLGQQKTVTVVRYVMNKTVEKNVQNRQFRKLRLAHGGFSGKPEKVKERAELLRNLILTDADSDPHET